MDDGTSAGLFSPFLALWTCLLHDVVLNRGSPRLCRFVLSLFWIWEIPGCAGCVLWRGRQGAPTHKKGKVRGELSLFKKGNLQKTSVEFLLNSHRQIYVRGGKVRKDNLRASNSAHAMGDSLSVSPVGPSVEGDGSPQFIVGICSHHLTARVLACLRQSSLARYKGQSSDPTLFIFTWMGFAFRARRVDDHARV